MTLIPYAFFTAATTFWAASAMVSALMIGRPLSANIFKFSPVRAGPEDLSRFHGTNERISLANLAELVRFYHRLLQQSAGS